jgi:aryl-alcohol dehydrogenase-like predicted oxidoreductase/enamine deaminase RidA (YjgF/YER057c/UK114 family)
MNELPVTQLAPDFSISKVITGLWQIADMERDGKELNPKNTSSYMIPYVEQGFTSFDMADHYGSAEVIAGTFRKDHPLGQKAQLFTKWVPGTEKQTKEDVRNAVLKALDRMKGESIDLMQFHAWNYLDPNWLECLFWLNELRKEGLIRHLGLTNFDADHLRVAVSSGIPIVSNQISYSLLDQRASGEMTEVCEQYGVKILAFGTIAGGFLTEKWLYESEPKPESLKTWSQMKYFRFIQSGGGWQRFQNILATISGIARKHGVSMANVASRHILDQPYVGGVIIGARLGESTHIADNQRLFQFDLDEEDKSLIEESQSNLYKIPGDCGDEYRVPPFLTASGDLSHHIQEIPKPYEAREMENGNLQVLSGTIWEDLAGFSRGIRRGNRILISGTTATHLDRLIGQGDARAQTTFILDKIQGVIETLGGELTDVIRTRIYIRFLDDWRQVSYAHGKRFKDIQPANTLVQTELVGDGYLVEIEVEAEVGD